MLQYESELEISRILVEWYETYKRELPWRETRDPYHLDIGDYIATNPGCTGIGVFFAFYRTFPGCGISSGGGRG